MQPYLFPYSGYFQLIDGVDSFVFYDDVNFIKQGWINRNRLLVRGEPALFSVPLKSASSFTAINRTYIHREQFDRWLEKFVRTLLHHYPRSGHGDAVVDLVRETMCTDTDDIALLAETSVTACCHYLGIDASFGRSSALYPSKALGGVERILDICRTAKATHYVNAPGGQDLYQHRDFDQAGISLSFADVTLSRYDQGQVDFVPGLSVLDIMMRFPVDQARDIVLGFDENLGT